MRSWGMAPPRLERLLPWLGDNVLASFLVYFVLYDFAAYWLHRAQHAVPWWWALHSLHHSQRRMTVWSDDRNHILDDFLMTLALVLFSQMVGVQPGEYVSILMVGRLIESWSHANVDMSFGKVGERLVVGPRFHRLHHALANPDERHIHDHNFAPVFPIWDILFGTAIYDGKQRPTGVDDPRIDADNGRGWIVQQVTVFGRFLRAVTPRFLRAPVQPGLRPPAE
jgi:sterol desaturase/sphingolipid hydroxylase (fatty acid hydroxylase superfamily)